MRSLCGPPPQTLAERPGGRELTHCPLASRGASLRPEGGHRAFTKHSPGCAGFCPRALLVCMACCPTGSACWASVSRTISKARPQGSPDTAAPAPTREGGKAGKGTLTRVCRMTSLALSGGQLGHWLWSPPCPQHLLLSWGPGVPSASPWEPMETGGRPRMGACPDEEALERFACMGQKPARGLCTYPPPCQGASEAGVSPRCPHCLAGPAAFSCSLWASSALLPRLRLSGGGTLPRPCRRPQACFPVLELYPGTPVCPKHWPLPLLWASHCDPGCLYSLVPGRCRKQSHSL